MNNQNPIIPENSNIPPTVSQQMPTVSQGVPKSMLLIIVAVVLVLMVVVTGVLIGVALILSSTKNTPAPVPTVIEQPITPPAAKVSKFASDSGLLKIRDDLKTWQTKIDTMDLFEQQITPPSLDLNISIPPQT